MARYYESDTQIPLGQDFVRRKRHGRISVMLSLFVLSVWLATWIATNPHLIDSHIGQFFVVMLVLSVPTAYILYVMQRNLDLVLGIEFQNALFSSVMREQADFTVIVNHEGMVEYADDGFESHFPSVPRDNVMEAMISIGALSHADTEKLYAALLHSHREYFTFPVPNALGNLQRMRVHITPLARPKGYFLWQGRNYVEEREQKTTDGAVKPSHIAQLQDVLPVGVYTIGPNGYIRSNNYTLEYWLGYEKDELVRRQFGIKDLHYRPDGQPADTNYSMYEHTFIGETLLRHKNGSLIKAHLRHYVAYNDAGQMVSGFGVVENHTLY